MMSCYHRHDAVHAARLYTMTTPTMMIAKAMTLTTKEDTIVSVSSARNIIRYDTPLRRVDVMQARSHFVSS